MQGSPAAYPPTVRPYRSQPARMQPLAREPAPCHDPIGCAADVNAVAAQLQLSHELANDITYGYLDLRRLRSELGRGLDLRRSRICGVFLGTETESRTRRRGSTLRGIWRGTPTRFSNGVAGRRLTPRCTGRQPLRGHPESYFLGVRLAPVSAEPLG